jgi:hypothetical protein
MSQKIWWIEWVLGVMRMQLGLMRQVSDRQTELISGAWLIHPVLILLGKILIDAIPGMTQDVSWTITNLGYMAVSVSSR